MLNVNVSHIETNESLPIVEDFRNKATKLLDGLKVLDKIISENNLQNEQVVLDFLDTLNAYSVKY